MKKAIVCLFLMVAAASTGWSQNLTVWMCMAKDGTVRVVGLNGPGSGCKTIETSLVLPTEVRVGQIQADLGSLKNSFTSFASSSNVRNDAQDAAISAIQAKNAQQ